MKLLIVESPNKVAAIQKYVGHEYNVVASCGHLTKLKDSRTNNFGFEATPDHHLEIDFEPNGTRGKKVIRTLRKLARQCDEIIIATDADREREAIDADREGEAMGGIVFSK
jgi:DNA topoisomerase-1